MSLSQVGADAISHISEMTGARIGEVFVIAYVLLVGARR